MRMRVFWRIANQCSSLLLLLLLLSLLMLLDVLVHLLSSSLLLSSGHVARRTPHQHVGQGYVWSAGRQAHRPEIVLQAGR